MFKILKGSLLPSWVALIGIELVNLFMLNPSSSVRSDPMNVMWPVGEMPEKQTLLIGKEYFGRFGEGLARGDVNGDGVPDLIIGDQFVAEGEVYVLTGPVAFNQSIHIPEQVALILRGAANQPQLGTYVDSGDLNGDGFDDIAIGSWISGKTYVYLGSASISTALPTAITVTPEVVALTVMHIDLGLAICNVNGDEFEDLFVETSEQVWGILGNPALSMTSPITINVSSDPVDITITGFQPEGGQLPGMGNLGCGDVDGDGYNDLVIGAPFESPEGRINAGNVYVFKGSAGFQSGQPVTLHVPDQADAILQGVTGRSGSGRVGDQLGQELSVADVDGDGQADLILGAPEADLVHLWLGRELSGQTVDMASESAWVLYGGHFGSGFGATIEASDLDRDGQAEVLLGCEHCELLSGSPYTVGRVFVLDAEQIQGVHLAADVAKVTLIPSSTTTGLGRLAGIIDLDADGYEDVILQGSNRMWGYTADEPRDALLVFSYIIHDQTYLPLIYWRAN